MPAGQESTSAEQGYSTFHFQEQLPRLPVPDLHSTAEKLLAWSRPLLTADEYAETEAAVREFVRPDGNGEKLQQALIDWSGHKGIDNWLEPFWDDIYLRNRGPIAVHITPFFLFRDLGMGQLEGAAALIRATLEFKKMIDAESLPVEFEGSAPLCMMQYRRIFSTERVPGAERDELRSPISEDRRGDPEAAHIMVLHQGNMYRMEVLGPDGKPLAAGQIRRGLQAVVEASEKAGPNRDALGALTGMERTQWATAREELRQIDPQNAESLVTIEKALFAVALESNNTSSIQELTAGLMHGEPRNRWYDKSFTLIAYPDGRLGMNFEHAGLDGTTVINMISRVFRLADKLPEETAVGAAAPIAPIAFTVNRSVRTALKEAEEGYRKLAEGTVIEILDFKTFGKELIKTFGMSPDGFIQVAFHLAQKRSWGFIGSTYESAMTRRFKHGRTEALRTVTLEAAEFVEAMENGSAPKEIIREKLRRAAAAHIARMKECKEGRGVDRHILGLLSIWQRRGERLGIREQPELFSSTGWNKLRYDILSTSRLASDDVEYFGFGPTTPECTGIGYAVHSSSCMFVLSAKDARREQLSAYTRNLNQALLDMAELMRE